MSTTDHTDHTKGNDHNRPAADHPADSCPEARIDDAGPGFTPGPWYISRKGGPFCVDATPAGSEPGVEDYRIAKTYASPFAPVPEQAAANARLIAAAPDLLAACKEALHQLTPANPVPMDGRDRVRMWLREAIARAEGREVDR